MVEQVLKCDYNCQNIFKSIITTLMLCRHFYRCILFNILLNLTSSFLRDFNALFIRIIGYFCLLTRFNYFHQDLSGKCLVIRAAFVAMQLSKILMISAGHDQISTKQHCRHFYRCLIFNVVLNFTSSFLRDLIRCLFVSIDTLVHLPDLIYFSSVVAIGFNSVIVVRLEQFQLFILPRSPPITKCTTFMLGIILGAAYTLCGLRLYDVTYKQYFSWNGVFLPPRSVAKGITSHD